jgi:hypothetical protein
MRAGSDGWGSIVTHDISALECSSITWQVSLGVVAHEANEFQVDGTCSGKESLMDSLGAQIHCRTKDPVARSLASGR